MAQIVAQSVTVPNEVEYTSHETSYAAAYHTMILEPGTYPIRFVTIDYRPVREDEQPYYAQADIPAKSIDPKFVVPIPDGGTFTKTWYAFSAIPGNCALGNGQGGILATFSE